MEIKKIIIWGHKLHSHTHSYIHAGYNEAFKYLGYDCYWFDNNDDVSNFDFSNSLFITEHQVYEKIPLRDDCLYFSHFISTNIFDNLPNENIIELKCAYRDFSEDIEIIPIENHTFVGLGLKYKIFYTIWATDLLPEEVQKNIDNLDNILRKREKNLYFIGSVYNIISKINDFCKKYSICYKRLGAAFDVNSEYNCSKEMNQDLIQKSYLAPAFLVEEHIEKNYVNCRTFKNISYGRMVLTNSKFINDLFFDNKLIYDEDIEKCFDLGIEFEDNANKLNVIKELMELVRDNHTYKNRVNSIIKFVNNFTKFKV